MSKHQEAQAQLNELQKEDKRTDAAILNYARRLKASEEVSGLALASLIFKLDLASASSAEETFARPSYS